jgi:hypothetical protein
MLRVLVTQDEPGAADDAVQELERAGHTVLRCCEPTAAAFPCAALRDPSSCPLRNGGVDVALAVRRGGHTQPTRREEGAVCAVRQHVPLVVAGSDVSDPFQLWESEALGRTDNVVNACERVARAPLREHTRRATKAIDDVLLRRNHRGLVLLVAVHRRDGRLDVTVRASEVLPGDVRGMIAVRIVAALRSYDRDATGIDVAITELHGCPSPVSV